MKTNKIFITTALLAISATSMAQGLNSAYFTTDFNARHTLNPAFGNEQNYVSIPGLGNLNVSMHGNFGYEDVIMNNPLYGQPGQKKMTTFMNPYISVNDALNSLSTGNNRIVTNVDVTILSAGFKGFGGYNTIELNAKSRVGVALPYELFEFAKNIGNNTYEIGDINVGARAYAELAFGHSRNITDKLRVGGKLKLLFGIAAADVQLQDVRADLSGTDQWTLSAKGQADVSMKGFMYKSEQKEYKDESKGTYNRVNDIDVDGAGLGGFGVAVDLGAVYKINEDWTVNAALLDLGFISWSNDMQAVNNGDTFIFDGFRDIDVSSKSNPSSMKQQGNKYSDQFADFANLKDKGDQGGRTTGIGATLNVGCQYNLPSYRKMTFGFLSSTRFNGPYTWTEARLSANWTPLKWLDGGVSFAANSFTTSMGWVLNVHPKGYNFFIGMDHLLGSTSKEMIPLSSNANLALGMAVSF